MKILLTGVSLSGNLGAPAMALSFIHKLKEKYQNSDITISVNPDSFQKELELSEKYNIKIIKRSNLLIHWANTLNFRKIKQFLKFDFSKNNKDILYKKANREYLSTIKESDVIINMSGISYIGDDTDSIMGNIRDHSDFVFTKWYNKKYIRFIQSYGPFTRKLTKYLAKREFKSLNTLFVRGNESSKWCKEITNTPVLTYPDVALLLNPDSSWAKDYLTKISVTLNNYVILSPSAVIRGLKKGKGVSENHIVTFTYLINRIRNEFNCPILLLPHTTSSIKRLCDKEVCYKILSSLDNKSNVHVINEQLDPMQAKGIIKFSSFAIVSRYHALIAALSSTCKVTSIGWNVKYSDILNYFDMPNMNIDARTSTPEEIARLAIDNINQQSSGEFHKSYQSKLDNTTNLLNDAFSKLYDIIECK